MNVRISTLIVIISLLGVECHADEPLPTVYDGSMMPYVLSADAPLGTVAPDSLQPVMINYVARHGARYLSSADKTTAVRKALQEARANGTLTQKGEAFLRLLDRVESATAGRWGALDSLGMAEQQALARQMTAMCPHLLSRGDMTAISSYVPRVVMSMYEFCHEQCLLSPSLDITAAEGRRYSPLLRYFDTDTAYAHYLKHGRWREVYTRYVAAEVPEGPARQLVGNGLGKDGGRYRALTMDLYAVLQSLRAAALPAPTTRWMSAAEYERCWRAANLKHILQRTATSLSSLPTRSAIPLLTSLIASMDSAGTASAPVADLRFGHAETLMPLFSLMQLPGCSPAMNAGYADLYKSWRDYEVVPLAANLLIVTLSSPSGTLYTCLRLNGRWVAPLPDGRLLVPYHDLRAHWLTLIEQTR